MEENLSLRGGSPDLSLWEAGPSAGCAAQAPETIGSSTLLGRVGGKLELAIKYEWHILFNFACDFFFTSVGLVTWSSDRERLRGSGPGFPIQTTLWVCVCRRHHHRRRPPGLLMTSPSVLSVCEALVSQIKTLLEPAVAADGYL